MSHMNLVNGQARHQSPNTSVVFRTSDRCTEGHGFDTRWRLGQKTFVARSHVESQENKKLCFCTASLAQMRIQCEASRAKTNLFTLLRLNVAPRDKGLYRRMHLT